MVHIHHSRSPLSSCDQISALTGDTEKQDASGLSDVPEEKQSAFKNLGILDRFLVAWIFLAMAMGIILGNFVPSTGPALQKGKFAEVSVPIGEKTTT